MRIFHNVGEGLFSVEKVANLIFVYDCGGQRFNDDKGKTEKHWFQLGLSLCLWHTCGVGWGRVHILSCSC